jgi:hypothetical protein
MTHEANPTQPEQATSPEVIANFNDEVLVKITPAGEEMWDAAHAEVRKTYPNAFPIARDEDGYTKLHLHEVANIFGPGMYNGNPRLPIKTTFKLIRKE